MRIQGFASQYIGVQRTLHVQFQRVQDLIYKRNSKRFRPFPSWFCDYLSFYTEILFESIIKELLEQISRLGKENKQLRSHLSYLDYRVDNLKQNLTDKVQSQMEIISQVTRNMTGTNSKSQILKEENLEPYTMLELKESQNQKQREDNGKRADYAESADQKMEQRQNQSVSRQQSLMPTISLTGSKVQVQNILQHTLLQQTNQKKIKQKAKKPKKSLLFEDDLKQEKVTKVGSVGSKGQKQEQQTSNDQMGSSKVTTQKQQKANKNYQLIKSNQEQKFEKSLNINSQTTKSNNGQQKKLNKESQAPPIDKPNPQQTTKLFIQVDGKKVQIIDTPGYL